MLIKQIFYRSARINHPGIWAEGIASEKAWHVEGTGAQRTREAQERGKQERNGVQDGTRCCKDLGFYFVCEGGNH
jgi:hypothetical protein